MRVAELYGPFAAFCVLLLVGAGWLVRYVLATSTKREERLLTTLETLAPRLQKVEDTQERNTAILNDIYSAVEGCDPRRDRVKARQA